MKNNNPFVKKLLPLALIVIVAVFSRFYHLENRYTFEWDQEDDANKVMEIINLHKPRLIGPRVVSDDNFFVGPYHYYFLTPFYFLTKGDPIAGAYAVMAVGVLTCTTVFFICNSIFGSPVGSIAGLIFALTPILISWNAMYTPIYSLLILYFCFQLTRFPGEKYFYLNIFFLSLASNTHLVPASLIIPIFFSILISGYRPAPKTIFFGLGLFLIPLLPLIIFELRHKFLNTTQLVEFITLQQTTPAYSRFLFLRTFWRSLGVLNLFSGILERIITLIALLSGVFLAKIFKIRLLVVVWILTPLLLLSFYRGNIPEYYYEPVTVLIPIFIAVGLSKIKAKTIVIFLLLIFTFTRLSKTFSDKSHVSLASKKLVVNSIITDSRGQNFSVYYNLPPGWNTGYEYLFKNYPKKIVGAPLRYLIYHTSAQPTGFPVHNREALGVVRL